jgi:ABC-type phosphate transport system substrate-binding protein
MTHKLTFRAPALLCLAVLSLALLIACGGDDDKSSGSTSSTSTPAARGTPGATLAAIAGTSTPAPLVTQAKQQYCEARDGFKASIQQLTTLNTSSSLDDVKRINGNIKAKWADLKASARNVGQLQLEELDKSITKLQSTIDSFGQNTGIVAAIASVALPAADVVQEIRKVDLDKPCTT